MFCKEQVAQLRDYVDRIREAGGELVILGNGTSQHARWFVEDTGLDVPLYTDPSLETYDIVGARRGFRSSMNGSTVRASLRAMRKGFRQGKTRGEGFQQGGVFVITPDNEAAYAYVSRFAGDHPDPEDAVAALEKVTRSSD